MAPVRIPYDAEDARRARGDEDVTPQFQACEGEPPTHRARRVTCRDDGRSFPAASQSVAHRRRLEDRGAPPRGKTPPRQRTSTTLLLAPCSLLARRSVSACASTPT